MKKIMFSLCTLLVCGMFASCGDPTAKLEGLTEKVEEQGDEWTDPDQWESVMRDYADAVMAFADSNPTEEEFENFSDAAKDFQSACYSIDSKKAKRARDKAEKRLDKDKELEKKMKDATKKLKKIEKKIKKKEKEEKEEEEEEYED